MEIYVHKGTWIFLVTAVNAVNHTPHLGLKHSLLQPWGMLATKKIVESFSRNCPQLKRVSLYKSLVIHAMTSQCQGVKAHPSASIPQRMHFPKTAVLHIPPHSLFLQWWHFSIEKPGYSEASMLEIPSGELHRDREAGGASAVSTFQVFPAQALHMGEEALRWPQLQPPSEGKFMRHPNPELHRQAASKFWILTDNK